MTNPPRTGTFLRIPYDWRRPTIARAKSRWWNPDEPRLFTPKVFGWGWDINFGRVLGRKPKRRVIAVVVISFVAILISFLGEWKRRSPEQ
jgi:uncharacterized membrane protein